VGSFQIDVADDRQSVEARFDAQSLEVVCRRKDGVDEPGGLSRLELGQIHGNIRDDVLGAKKHPQVTFRSTRVTPAGDGFRVEGDLTLHGTTRPIAADVKREGDRLRAEVKLHQPDFGIKPYSAALGALKVKAGVVVTVSVPA
jgi:polyisoprenoid-binding protein YceI